VYVGVCGCGWVSGWVWKQVVVVAVAVVLGVVCGGDVCVCGGGEGGGMLGNMSRHGRRTVY
jgi:hypothetical protein